VAAGDDAVKKKSTYSAPWIAGKKSTALEAFKITANGLFYVANRETDAVCVCVCERERERVRECMCMSLCVCVRERERVCVCVCDVDI
jgi:hypothetical protein